MIYLDQLASGLLKRYILDMQATNYLRHLFYPHHTNNHKAKVLHSGNILLLTALIVIVQVVISYLPKLGVKVLGYAANISIDEVVRLTNQKRSEAGLQPLTYNGQLSIAAKAKGDHMLLNDYWAHVAPDGTQPWKFFSDAGYKYKYAGENLARDFSNASSAIDAWMASPSHKENILASKYKEIGIAVVEGDLSGSDTTIIIQLFGTQYADSLPVVPIAKADTNKAISTPIPTKTSIQPTKTPITPTPTEEIAPTPTSYESIATVIKSSPPNTISKTNVLISPFQTTRSVSLGVTILLISVMSVDAVVVHKKKIPRIGGRTIAHMAFLVTVLAIVIIARAGEIL